MGIDDIDAIVDEIQAFSKRFFNITLRDHQLEWLHFILGSGERCLLLSPRRHGKSVLLRIYMLWRISRNPKIRIIVVANTESLASSIIRGIQRTIEHHADVFRDEFGITPGSPWRITGCHLFGQPHVDPVLSAKAGLARVTGMSSDLILMDDVIIPDNVSTPAQYRKLKAWIDGELWNTLDPMHEMVLILGTRKGMIDWYSELLDNPDVDSLVNTAIIQDDDGNDIPLWQGPDFEGRGFTMEKLLKKQRASPDLFDREWMNSPALSEGYRFHREDIKFFEQLPHHNYLTYYIGVDPAYGKEKRASMTAICVIAYDSRDDTVYVVEMFKDRMSLIEQVDKVEELYRKYDPQSVIIESIMGFGLMYDEYERRIPKTQPLFYPEKIGKELRIESTLAPLFRDGNLLFRDPDNDHFTQVFVETELMEFGGDRGLVGSQNKSPMDLLDALCIAMSEIQFNNDESEPYIRAVRARTY